MATTVAKAAPPGAALVTKAGATSEPDAGARALTRASMMLAAVLATLDSTIANVALPPIRSSLSASSEQILWVGIRVMAEIISITTPVSRLRASLRALHSAADMTTFTDQFCRELDGTTLEQARMMRREAMACFCEIIWGEHSD
jgi:hypothetical protein